MDDALKRLAAERAETRERLEALRRELASMVDAVDTSTDDEHDPEGITAFERAQTRSLIVAAEQQLVEMDLAEQRIAAGTYNDCEQCGSPIGDERLEARPTATMCVTCASARR